MTENDFSFFTGVMKAYEHVRGVPGQLTLDRLIAAFEGDDNVVIKTDLGPSGDSWWIYQPYAYREGIAFRYSIMDEMDNEEDKEYCSADIMQLPYLSLSDEAGVPLPVKGYANIWLRNPGQAHDIPVLAVKGDYRTSLTLVTQY